MAVDHLEKLRLIKAGAGKQFTPGIAAETLQGLVEDCVELREAIDLAWEERERLLVDFAEYFTMEERELAVLLQQDYVNFYPANTRCPFVSLGAKGPWIVTLHGAVLHDSAGYGMLGMGHNVPSLLAAMARPQVMANVMTPSFAQIRFTEKLKREIGHTRGTCPFSRFICMNSGSEAVSVAARISDINTNEKLGPGGQHEGRIFKRLTLEGSFHGRTYRAARVSHCTRKVYTQNLASFKGVDDLVTVPPNDLAALAAAFAQADKDNVFLEAFFMEPVMGEGVPGRAITREFYDLARKLTRAHGSMLIMDSIQAALRAQGCLSIVDYPGFEDCEAPDCETYSKALNAGQYPLSVLALTAEYAAKYIPGVYGNTMTTAPRALDVGCLVLDSITPEVRQAIRDKGQEFIDNLQQIATDFPDRVVGVTGTGLLVNIEFNPDKYKVVADQNGLEEYMRRNGIFMIHGGTNGLRFTPHFGISTREIKMICEVIRQGLKDLA